METIIVGRSGDRPPEIDDARVQAKFGAHINSKQKSEENSMNNDLKDNQLTYVNDDDSN